MLRRNSSYRFHRLKKRANVRAAEKMVENESIPESEVERAEAIRVKVHMCLSPFFLLTTCKRLGTNDVETSQ